MSKNKTWSKRNCPVCDSHTTPRNPAFNAKFPAEECAWGEVKDAYVGFRNYQIFSTL